MKHTNSSLGLSGISSVVIVADYKTLACPSGLFLCADRKFPSNGIEPLLAFSWDSRYPVCPSRRAALLLAGSRPLSLVKRDTSPAGVGNDPQQSSIR